MTKKVTSPAPKDKDTYSTKEVSDILGLAVRSIQLMVDRDELEAWRTPGGHRRITRESVERWQAGKPTARNQARKAEKPSSGGPTILLIEDSQHYQRLIKALIEQEFPDAQLHIAGDGITGLALYGKHSPDVLIVDILLPNIDGPTLIATLRTDPLFSHSKLIVVTSLDPDERAQYAYALADLPVIHKPNLVADLPKELRHRLAEPGHATGRRQVG